MRLTSRYKVVGDLLPYSIALLMFSDNLSEYFQKYVFMSLVVLVQDHKKQGDKDQPRNHEYRGNDDQKGQKYGFHFKLTS